LTGAREVQVAALNGFVRVFSKTGVLVARLDPRMANTFDPSAAPPDSFDMNGCLIYHPDGRQFGLVVENQLYQAKGSNLARNVGNRVHLVGKLSTETGIQGVSAVVEATSMELTESGGCTASAGRFPGWSAKP